MKKEAFSSPKPMVNRACSFSKDRESLQLSSVCSEQGVILNACPFAEGCVFAKKTLPCLSKTLDAIYVCPYCEKVFERQLTCKTKFHIFSPNNFICPLVAPWSHADTQ